MAAEKLDPVIADDSKVAELYRVLRAPLVGLTGTRLGRPDFIKWLRSSRAREFPM